MSDHESTDRAQRERLDKLCDRFEVAWKNGWRKQSLENVLADATAADREHGLWMLIELEIDYRRRDGESPALEEYVARFPELRERLPELFVAATVITPPPVMKFKPQKGERIGNYELLEKLGQGGMGLVFKAQQLKPNRLVALKMILGGQLATDELVQRFRKEADAAAKLDHPGIVPVYEVGEVDGLHFFSMGLVEGDSLAKRVSSGPLPPKDAAEIMRQIANAVHYAHERGVIHRDLKPANIMLSRGAGFPPAEVTSNVGHISNVPSTDGQVENRPHSSGTTTVVAPASITTVWEAKITDFGLAKLMEGDSGLTATGHLMGTPSYMPPEQAQGHHAEIGRHSDVYSLGAVLYCLLLGRPPFQAASVPETLRQVINQEPVAPRQLNSSLPRDLETICLKCLQKEPSRRYPTALELAEELGRYQRREPILARPVSSIERLGRWAARNPMIASLTLTIIVLLSVTAAVATTAYISTRKTLAESYLDLALADAGAEEIGTSLLRLTKAVETAAGIQPEIEWAARTNLSAWETNYQAPLLELHHDFDVRSVAFSPDGKKLLSGSGKVARLWNAETGELSWPPIVTGNGRLNVAFFPNGDRFATSNEEDESIRIWNSETGEPIGEPMKPRDSSNGRAIAVSPKGNMVLTGYADGTVRLWNTDTGECLSERVHGKRDPNGQNWVYSVAFNDDGTKAITSGRDATAKVWRVEPSGALELETEIKQGGYVFGARFRQTEKDGYVRAITCGLKAALQWRLEPEPRFGRYFVHTGDVFGIAISPDGRRLLTGADDRTASLWEISTGEKIVSFRHGNNVRSVAFSPDGRRAVTGCDDGYARVWSIPQDRAGQLREFPHGDSVNSIRFSRDGKKVVTASSDKTAIIWSADSGEPLLQLKHSEKFRYAEFSPDGSHVLALIEGKAFLFQADGQARPRDLVKVTEHLKSAAFHPNGLHFVTGSDQGTVLKWDVITGQTSLIGNHEPGQNVGFVSFDPRKYRLMTGSSDHTARIWQTNDAKPLILTHDGPVTALAWSHDGSLVATASSRTAQIWNANSGQQTSASLRHNDDIQALAFSPDSEMLLVGSKDFAARLWSVRTSKLIRSIPHREQVRVVGFHPRGQLLVTGDESGRFQFWHVATGRAVGPGLKHANPASSFEFSPDGRTIATSSFDSFVRLWKVPEPMAGTSQEITRAMQILTRTEMAADGVIRQLLSEEVKERSQQQQPVEHRK